MFHHCKSSKICRQAAANFRLRPKTRRAMTLLELMLAVTVMLMVLGALGGLTRTVEQGFEYSEGYGAAVQYARVILDRIARNLAQATANEQFPGCLVIPDYVNSHRLPDTLVIWRPQGSPASPTGLPRYCELVIYCPLPSAPNRFVELTVPNDARTVPPVDDEAQWRAELSAIKSAGDAKVVVLTDLLRTVSLSTGNNAQSRGAVRFEVQLRPSAADWAAYQSGAVTWMNMPWVQGIYGSQTGMRQVWLRSELQLVPASPGRTSNSSTLPAVPFLGSATLYYQLNHP